MSDSADSAIPAQQTNLSQPSSDQISNPFSQPTDTTTFIQSQSIQPPSASLHQTVPLRSTVPQPRNLNQRLSMEAYQQAPDYPALDPFSDAAVLSLKSNSRLVTLYEFIKVTLYGLIEVTLYELIEVALYRIVGPNVFRKMSH